MEFPSPQAGVVKSLTVKVGDKIKEGSVVLQLEAAGGADEQPAEPAKKAEPAQAAQQASAASAPAAAAQPSAQQGQGETTTVVVPDIGDSTDVQVIEILASVGDTIAADIGRASGGERVGQ